MFPFFYDTNLGEPAALPVRRSREKLARRERHATLVHRRIRQASRAYTSLNTARSREGRSALFVVVKGVAIVVDSTLVPLGCRTGESACGRGSEGWTLDGPHASPGPGPIPVQFWGLNYTLFL